MICPSCGNRFLQPFVCTICLYNVRSAEAARPQMEVLENENVALREEIRELNQMGFTHENAAAQKAALDASEYICTCGIRVTPHKCSTDNGF